MPELLEACAMVQVDRAQQLLAAGASPQVTWRDQTAMTILGRHAPRQGLHHRWVDELGMVYLATILMAATGQKADAPNPQGKSAFQVALEEHDALRAMFWLGLGARPERCTVPAWSLWWGMRVGNQWVAHEHLGRRLAQVGLDPRVCLGVPGPHTWQIPRLVSLWEHQRLTAAGEDPVLPSLPRPRL